MEPQERFPVRQPSLLGFDIEDEVSSEDGPAVPSTGSDESPPTVEQSTVDEHNIADVEAETTPPNSIDDSLFDPDRLDELSVPFLGRWQRLVSTSNWEKGRIILQWREALIADGAPLRQYADEAWASRVETVTGQHVGRLRRVYQRFGSTQGNFEGLFWSHFQAALDWDDAEMWLEGAVQNSWSVSAMRHQRWEAMGGRATDRPHEEDIVIAELDEDHVAEEIDREISGSYDEAHAGPLHEGPDFGDAEDHPLPPISAAARQDDEATEPVALVSPFLDVEQLPGDLGDAVEAMKLAILRHKASGWSEVNAQFVLDNLEALKQLLLAPSDERG